MLEDDAPLYRMIGSRIRSARERKKMSQDALATKLKVSRASVVNIEAGRQHAPVHVLWRIAETLDTELGILIPHRDELRPMDEPVHLSSDVVAHIEAAANGDSETRHLLQSFISRVTARQQRDT